MEIHIVLVLHALAGILQFAELDKSLGLFNHQVHLFNLAILGEDSLQFCLRGVKGKASDEDD